MPDTSDKILKQLSTEEKSLDFGALKPGTVTGDSEVLFARIDEKSLMEQIEAERKKTDNEKVFRKGLKAVLL